MAVSATSSITTALGAGSGIDIGTLVPALVEAQFAAKTKRLTAQNETLTAQVSGVAKLKSAITGFDKALKALAESGTLTTQPSSSNTQALRVSAIAGGGTSLPGGTIEVRQLAQGQAATTREPVGAAAAFKAGKLSFAMGTETKGEDGTYSFAPGTSFDIDINADTNLAGVAAAINAAKKGITASVVSDGDGVRLQLKGPSGAAGAFRVTGTANADADAAALDLSALNVSRDGGSAAAIGVDARDAILVVDGAEFRRSSNTVTDLMDGVRMELAATGTSTLTTAAPTTAITQAVQDFVATYNEMLGVLKEETNATTGALKGDSSAAALTAGLKRLTTQNLATGSDAGAPRMLADLGVATARDGTLSVDTNKLAAVMTKYPAQVEAMFAQKQGLPAAMTKLSTEASSSVYGLTASADRYARLQKRNTADAAALTTQAEAAKTRLTRVYAAMDSRVAAYKSTQTFMDNQIKAWNRSDS